MISFWNPAFRQITKIWSVKFLSDRIEKGIEAGLKTRKKDRFAIIHRMLEQISYFSVVFDALGILCSNGTAQVQKI